MSTHRDVSEGGGKCWRGHVHAYWEIQRLLGICTALFATALVLPSLARFIFTSECVDYMELYLNGTFNTPRWSSVGRSKRRRDLISSVTQKESPYWYWYSDVSLNILNVMRDFRLRRMRSRHKPVCRSPGSQRSRYAILADKSNLECSEGFIAAINACGTRSRHRYQLSQAPK